MKVKLSNIQTAERKVPEAFLLKLSFCSLFSATKKVSMVGPLIACNGISRLFFGN